MASPQAESLSPKKLQSELPALCALLEDAVEGGASIGFINPMPEGESEAYWRSLIPGIEDGSRIVVISRAASGQIAGSVQIELVTRPNGLHRAAISKLMVLRSARKQGLGRALMEAAEGECRRLGRTTLVLDTRFGDEAERLYRALGWTLTGLVPRYARNSNGKMDASAFYHKLLE